ncbi:CPBP family glutamic-type intramembrane protease [Chryseolinea lacunae]|uniref:CPBP family intramembrane metalloprotease n=1 Tax=Chryseolinea lacunae TaxID=2801331 RepID=A0ABS1KLE6_9BACT|nr:CPBP family glutamic-type intramembrane protease [Chryseolinea lacunae]MBL0740266.1 CPBP family intramembrane metalloprotease [Chryseolinea lacunae]
MTPAYYSPRIRMFEIIAVVVTGLGKFVMVDFLQLKFWYVTSASLLWLVYILYRIKTNPGAPAYWGFRKEGFGSSLRWIGPVALLALAVFVTLGLLKRTLLFNEHLVFALLLYPVWGTIQQFLIIGLLVRNLKDMEGVTIKTPVIVAISAIVFSVVHVPSLPLVFATLGLAIGYSLLYLRYRNLWILGLFHGWMGGFFYFFVLGRDAWLEFVKAVQ